MRTYASADDLNRRMVRSGADAAADCTTAAVAAYAHMAQQTMSYWMNAFQVVQPEPEPKSWYRPPADSTAGREAARRRLATLDTTPKPFDWAMWPQWFLAAWMPSLNSPWTYWSWPHPLMLAGETRRAMPDPFSLWLRAWPLQGPPASWPMAFAMLGAGWPREVAYPAARANLAMTDVAKTATEAVDAAFSSYRTENGYATAQIRMSLDKKAVAVAVAPVGAALMAPWVALFGSAAN